MKKTLLFVSCCTLLLSSCTDHINFGGINTETTKNDRTISVTGSADVEVPPDEIELVIQLSEYSHDKKESIEKIQDELTEKLQAAGVAKSNISLKDVGNQNYWVYYWNWYYWNNPNQRPYITRQISVKLESMLQVDKVVESLQMRGISNVYLGKTSNKNLSEYRKQVKLEAIKMAKEKAENMLNAIGEKIGSVISIKEVDGDSSSTTRRSWGGRYGYPYWDYPYYGYGYGYYGGKSGQNLNNVSSNSNMNASNITVNGGTNPSAPGEAGMKKIKLRYEVEAVFEIARQ
jgi:uncharacterized protein YggE